MKKKIVHWIKQLFTRLGEIIVFGIFITFIGLILNAFQSLWIVTTPLFVVIVTLIGLFGDSKSAFLSIAGITLYMLSWPVTKDYGMYIGMSVYTLGLLTWFYAAYLGLCKTLGLKKTSNNSVNISHN